MAWKSRLAISTLTKTLLPWPVAPAMSRWGIRVRSPTMAWPETSLPTASPSESEPARKLADSTTSRIETRLADLLGTSIPTADLPGIGASIRSGAAARARERSFWSAVMRFTCTPAAG